MVSGTGFRSPWGPVAAESKRGSHPCSWQGGAFEDVSQVAVGLDAVGLRRFNQAVERRTRVGSPRGAAEKPVLSFMRSSA